MTPKGSAGSLMKSCPKFRDRTGVCYEHIKHQVDSTYPDCNNKTCKFKHEFNWHNLKSVQHLCTEVVKHVIFLGKQKARSKTPTKPSRLETIKQRQANSPREYPQANVTVHASLPLSQREYDAAARETRKGKSYPGLIHCITCKAHWLTVGNDKRARHGNDNPI